MGKIDNNAYLMGAAEALLFVSDEPVSAVRLATFLEVQPSQMDEILQALASKYEEEGSGIQLREVAGGWRLYSHPAYHELIEGYILSWDTRRMSQAALEALAVIAYHQPVTRAAVNAIRGVNSEGVISSLVEKGLVKEVGREKSAGSAILYGTTRTFLEKFGLKSTRDLPPLEDFAPDEATKEFIRQRLSGTVAGAEAVESDEDAESALQILLVNEDGEPMGVEDVDSGEGERIDDPEAMSELLGVAMTEKVDEAVFSAKQDEQEEARES